MLEKLLPGLWVPEEAVQVGTGVHVGLDVGLGCLGLLVAMVTVTNLAARTTFQEEEADITIKRLFIHGLVRNFIPFLEL
jgi:hypothetical protein